MRFSLIKIKGRSMISKVLKGLKDMKGMLDSSSLYLRGGDNR
jgi:DnaJ-class molecular chaperone